MSRFTVLLLLCLTKFGEILHKVAKLLLFIVDIVTLLLGTTVLHSIPAEAVQAVNHHLISM